VTLGIFFVVFWLLVVTGAILLAATYGMRWLRAWLSTPEELPLPPPTASARNASSGNLPTSLWKRFRRTKSPNGNAIATPNWQTENLP